MTDKKLVYGFGIDDASYQTRKRADGKVLWRCPLHERWKSMIQRCYSEKEHARNQTYIGCSVCDEWIYFSNFKGWMIDQDWEGNELDKDILFLGNKVYSPETCVFVPRLVNTFVIDQKVNRGQHPLGVSFNKNAGKFMARCNNPLTKKLEYLGYFTDPDQAHQAWRKRKHELACQLADSEYVTDERVAVALRSRYL